MVALIGMFISGISAFYMVEGDGGLWLILGMASIGAILMLSMVDPVLTLKIINAINPFNRNRQDVSEKIGSIKDESDTKVMRSLGEYLKQLEEKKNKGNK